MLNHCLERLSLWKDSAQDLAPFLGDLSQSDFVLGDKLPLGLVIINLSRKIHAEKQTKRAKLGEKVWVGEK